MASASDFKELQKQVHDEMHGAVTIIGIQSNNATMYTLVLTRYNLSSSRCIW